jgi:hypothetical protein
MIATLCLMFLAVTMFFRANDLRRKTGIIWHVRKLGLIVTGVAALAVIAHDWILMMRDFTTSETALLIGLVLVFLTSPHLPPYWKWISGKMAAPGGTA